MSDVWQGPGWWLASDGKWYPADAEPGAVYEGDLSDPASNGDSASVSTVETDTAEPAAATGEQPPAAVPSVEEPEVDVFAAMPTPVVEEAKVGGWQAIDPGEVDEAPGVDPTLIDPVVEIDEDDGWTSAFDERHTPEIPEPEVAIPDVDVPDMAIPDLAAPEVAIPDMAIPDVSVPDVDVPEVTVPDVAIPDMAIPDVTVPDVTVPEVTVPEVAAPQIGGEPSVAAVANVPSSVEPIERTDAWRKPNELGTTTRSSPQLPPVGAPDVVDLAVPQDQPQFAPEPQNSNVRNLLFAILGLAAVIAAALLIASLLGGDDGDDVQATDTTPATSAAVDDTTPVVEEEDDSDVSVFDLRAGDCIVGDIGAGQVTEVTRVDCEEEHQFEVYREALIDSTIEIFDEDAISQYAEEVCRTSLEAYVPPDDPRGLQFKFLQPTENSWNQAEEPDRVITCLLFDDDAPLVGRAG